MHIFKNMTECKVEGDYSVRLLKSLSDKSVDLVITVDPDISTNDSHYIATTVESLITEKFGVADISIHVEPYHGKTR